MPHAPVKTAEAVGLMATEGVAEVAEAAGPGEADSEDIKLSGCCL